MSSNRFHHIPYEVEAMQVLDNNITELIQWLGEDFIELHNQQSYQFSNTQITIPARSEIYGKLSVIVTYRDPSNSAQILFTVVYNGDVLVRERNHTYVVYTMNEFNQLFAPVEEFDLDTIDELEEELTPCSIDPDDEEIPVDDLEELDKGSELTDASEMEVRGMDIEDLFSMSTGLALSPTESDE